jgi:hypothetical protein
MPTPRKPTSATVSAITASREALANLRATWPDYQKLPQRPAETSVTTPTETPITDLSLPDALQELIKEEDARGPLELLKYVRSVNGTVVQVIDDGSALPEESKLVQLSLTTTALRIDGLATETHALIGRANNNK